MYLSKNDKARKEHYLITNCGRVQIRYYAPNSSVSLIEQYLAKQLTDGGSVIQSPDSAKVVIDVDLMGVPRGAEPPERGKESEEVTYPIRIAYSWVLLGPLMDTKSPCPTCLERRWLDLRPAVECRTLEETTEYYIFGQNPGLTSFALKTIWEVLQTAFCRRNYSAGSEDRDGELYGLSLETLRLMKYQLIPDSLCPVCSDRQPDSPSLGALRLSSRPKTHPTSSRLVSSQNIKIPTSAYVNPVCGVLGATTISDYSNVLTTPVSGRFHVRGTRGEHTMWWSGHANSYKESLTLGILEGLERHAGLLPRKRDISVFDSLNNLGEEALNPIECGVYEPDFYRKQPNYFTPFTSDLKIHWVWGYSLTQMRPILVPEQLVYYTDYTKREPLFVQECSNGCATGSCIEEAILYGLLELIERDTFLISWYAALALPQIDPWSCQQKDILLLLDRIERMNCDIHLLDMRLDLGIPSVMGFTRRRDQELGAVVFSAGARLDPEDAVGAALCEIASYLSDFSRRVAAEEERARGMLQDFRNVGKLGDHTLLYGLPEMAQHVDFLLRNPVFRTVEETYKGWINERPQNPDLLADLQYCIGRLRSAGLNQVIAVDQTSPEQERLGLKTACVIVPGMLPIDFGYERRRVVGLRRLHTVPRTAGFRATDLTNEEINPLPHPFP